MRHWPDVYSEAPGVWWATCRCGWVGRVWPTRPAAETDADEHVLASVEDDKARR